MAKLAIKGHPTRGNEVIEILEMLGGINKLLLVGIGKGIYFINTCDNINYYNQQKDIIDDFTILTLEEFLEKFPYKIGDKVVYENIKRKVTKMVWEEHTNTVAYKLDDKLYCNVIKELQPYKEETMEVTKEFYNKYCIKCGSQRCTAEGEWLKECKHYKEETMKELRIDFTEGYGYAGIENKQVIFTKIKPQYPKTYEESKAIIAKYLEMDCNPNSELILSQIPVHEFCKLIVARNAYWKIAGEQMGLGKPWEPDWLNTEQDKFVIYTHNNVIHLNCFLLGHNVLAFPTFEIRAMFYENFKELIESCKELL